MANYKQHFKAGAIVGTIAGVVLYIYQYSKEKEEDPEAKFDWGKFILLLLTGCAVGAITGIAADKLEPATNPNHRKFFHSITFWILSGLTVCKVSSSNRERLLKDIVIMAFAGYSTHLIMDMQTQKSLPLLGF
jgi:membrane-bound metal-dependent hydrolase YbcI (DUF457 family)